MFLTLFADGAKQGASAYRNGDIKREQRGLPPHSGPVRTALPPNGKRAPSGRHDRQNGRASAHSHERDRDRSRSRGGADHRSDRGGLDSRRSRSRSRERWRRHSRSGSLERSSPPRERDRDVGRKRGDPQGGQRRRSNDTAWPAKQSPNMAREAAAAILQAERVSMEVMLQVLVYRVDRQLLAIKGSLRRRVLPGMEHTPGHYCGSQTSRRWSDAFWQHQ